MGVAGASWFLALAVSLAASLAVAGAWHSDRSTPIPDWAEASVLAAADRFLLMACVCSAVLCSALSFAAGPRVFGERISKQHLAPIHKQVQDKIVLYHNYFRANVQPSARDMLRMVRPAVALCSS